MSQPSAAPPIDLSALASQTGGDERLTRDVLTMFAARAPADLAAMKATEADGRKAIAHRLVGSARAVGAEEVARLAREVEAGHGDLGALGAAIARAVAFIASRHGA